MLREFMTFRSGRYNLAATIDLPDKVAIAAAKGEPPLRRVPGVIFCHGFTGHRIESRRMYARLGAQLASQGILCMRFDHRGCGESQGDFVDFTPEGMLEDLDCALEAFLSLMYVDQAHLAVVGYSLGGTSASYILDRHPDFVTAVLWAPVGQPEIIRERISQLPGFEGYAERGYYDLSGFRVSREYLDGVGQVMKPVEWARGFKGPILFLHGEDDEVVVPGQSDRFVSARGNAADRLVRIPGADHGFSTAANIDFLLERSRQWLVEKLGVQAQQPHEHEDPR